MPDVTSLSPMCAQNAFDQRRCVIDAVDAGAVDGKRPTGAPRISSRPRWRCTARLIRVGHRHERRSDSVSTSLGDTTWAPTVERSTRVEACFPSPIFGPSGAMFNRAGAARAALDRVSAARASAAAGDHARVVAVVREHADPPFVNDVHRP